MFNFSKRENLYFVIVVLAIYIPVQMFYLLTLLPYFPLKVVGKGNGYKKKHYILNEHIHQFILQPKNYMKHIPSIHRQIVKESENVKSQKSNDVPKSYF